MLRLADGNEAGDGEPHSVRRPELVRPPTPTDLLEGMLARDDAPRSATTLVRDMSDSATCLGQTAAVWWRISRHLSPAVAEQIDADDALATRPTKECWSALACELDPRLIGQGDWPALALLMEDPEAAP